MAQKRGTKSVCRKASSRFTGWILKRHVGKENLSLSSSVVLSQESSEAARANMIKK